jgi:CheY-like chemotaxis protein
MTILIAEDNPLFRRVLEATLVSWGHEVVVTEDGTAAWEVLSGPDPPRLAILDWLMPGIDGPTLCRRVRETAAGLGMYLILLTAQTGHQCIVAGLDSGADDYITKPFDSGELRARINVGMRMATLQKSLSDRVAELEQAVERVRLLQGLLPICCYCKRIRDDRNYWQRVEEYLAHHSGVQFSHGICPDCYDAVVQEQLGEHALRQDGPIGSGPDLSHVI